MDKRLERILPQVQKPARYTGGEYNQIIKDKDSVDIRLAFANEVRGGFLFTVFCGDGKGNFALFFAEQKRFCRAFPPVAHRRGGKGVFFP